MENHSTPTTETQPQETQPKPSPAPISNLAAAYAKAQGEFRTPSLNRTAVIKNASGQVLYTTDYADIQECIDCIKEPLSKNGLSFTQTTQPIGGAWYLVLELMHASGETKRTLLPIDVNKPPQQLGGLLTYLKRYQISAFFGLAADFDDDGNAAEGKGNVVEGSQKGKPADPPKTPPAKPPVNNPPMQKALDKAPIKNHAPGASNPPEKTELDKALDQPSMTTLEKIYAIVDERGWTPEVAKEKIKLCLGVVKSTDKFTVDEQEKFLKYLNMTTK